LKRPIGVTLISSFYTFGAAVLLLTAIFMDEDANVSGIADRFGLPNFPERLFRIMLASVTLILIFGIVLIYTVYVRKSFTQIA
jgi:hypothetical protein